ncbi:MAG: asparagine--tRNA ligase [Actinobacteria bacterium]|nr:asparagine--tRNA ligase [Actinomycetota bacterium]
MVKDTYINDVSRYDGKKVIIKGWLYNKRSSGNIVFLLIRDGTGIMQCVVSKNNVDNKVFESAQKITQESSLIVTGNVHKEERAIGGYELFINDIKILQIVSDYPITPKSHGVGFLMKNRHLWLRSKKQHAILKIRAEVIKACREYLDKNGFINIDTPILTPAACEGTSTLFETKYFDQMAYLSQSGQLYNEATIMSFGKVYCYGPTFRAEKSKTRRHLMEFWMIEPEMAYFDWEDNIEIQEEFVTYIVQTVLKNRRNELEILERNLSKLEIIKPPFPKISYDEALEILKKKSKDINWGDDFGAGEETIISKSFDKPVFIHHYPMKCKAFYMKPDPERPDVSLSNDLIAPEGYGEIIGGGQRIDNLELLEEKIMEHNLPRDAFKWYLDLRKYGTVPHSGFGLGIERTVAWICKLKHIRETIPFPRLLYKIYP